MAILGLFTIASQIMIPLGTNIADAATTTTSTATYYLGFSNNATSSTAPGAYYSSSNVLSKAITIPSGSGTPTSTAVTINGTTTTVTPSGNTVTVSGTGKVINLTGNSISNPGHHFTRTGDGASWQHQGIRTHNLEFDAPSSSMSGGVSQWPGPIPNLVYDLGTNAYSTHQAESYGSDLWDNGLAVSYSDSVDPPTSFTDGSNSFSSSQVDPNTVTITDAVQDLANPAPITKLEVGKSPTYPGKGMVRVERPVDQMFGTAGTIGNSCTKPGMDYIDSSLSGGAIDRNYCLTIDTTWSASVYSYQGSITITYSATTYADLGSIGFTAPSCVDDTKAYTYNFTFSNSGPDVTTPFNVTVAADGTVFQTISYSTAPSGQTQSGSFSYMFPSSVSKTFTITLDAGKATGDADTSNNVGQFPVTPASSCSNGGGGSAKVTGTLSVKYPSVKFGTEQEIIQMKNVSVSGGGCSMKSGTMVFTQGNIKWTHNLGQSGDFDDPFTATTGNGIGPGSVSVEYDIVSDCGWSTVIGPGSFEVTTDSSLSPPQFEISWFNSPYYSGYNTPITMIPIGETISFGLITRPKTRSDNGTPYDPNGASVMYTTDIKTSSDPWIQKLYSVRGYGIHDDHFANVVADAKGSHTINMTGIDDLGAMASPQKATIEIVDPNPIPIITLPSKVIEGRPYTPAISCADSYSPYKARTIASCDWHGTKLSVYPTHGSYSIKLDVTDSAGLTSLSPATATLNVLEDLPPIPQVAYSSTNIRNVDIPFIDTTYSPDGDKIVIHTDVITCDTNQNGSFADETGVTMTLDANGKFSYKASVVGNCKLTVYAKEDWGKSAAKDFLFTVANQQPDADVGIFGEQPQPPVIRPVSYTTQNLLDASKFNSATLDKANYLPNYLYNSSEDALLSPDMDQAKTLGYTSASSVVVPYKAPTTTNAKATTLVTLNNLDLSYLTSMRSSRHGWITTGYMDAPSGFGVYNPWARYGKYFFSEDGQGGYSVPNGTGDSSNIYHLNDPNQYSACYGTPACGGDVEYHYNFDANMYWIRIIPKNGVGSVWVQDSMCGYHETNYDYIYHISDVMHGTSGTTTPYYSKTQTIYKDVCTGIGTYVVPKPSVWIEPVSVRDTMTTTSGKVVPHYNSDKYTYSSHTTSHTAYVGGDYEVDIDGIYLQKTDLSGNVIWQSSHSTPIHMNSYNQAVGATDVIMVSSDGSKLVTNALEIYDNNTGVYLGLVPPNASYDPTRPAETYNDKVIVVTNNSTNVYDVITGVTATLPSGGKITSDNKYVTADTSALYIYSLDSGNLLYSIPYNKSSLLYGTISVTQVVVSEDGKALITLNGGSYLSLVSITSDAFASNVTATGFDYGMLTDKTQTMQNGTVSLSLKFAKDHYTDSTGAGIVFRQQDNKNMYRVEATTSTISLVKIVNGVKTVLGKSTYPSDTGKYYPLMVKARGSKITVSYNGVPVIKVDDTSFSSGNYGIFDEFPNVYLKGLQANLYQDDTDTQANVVIVGTNATYDMSYSDPDSDPAISDLSKWTFTNLQPNKFLDAGDGYSEPSGQNSYVNYVSNSPMLIFNKVGVYKIDYQVPDDPSPSSHRYPDNMFASFRLYSDPVSHQVTVHRPPISNFTVATNTDGTLTWNEGGYDPDRWLSTTNYSTEKAEYQTNRGIYQRKYTYTTPNGILGSGQLIRPLETGTYTLREAVADEYGAWSDWYEQTLSVTRLPVNNAPTVTLTYPYGTQTSPSYSSTLTPTITWTQADADAGTVFGDAQIIVRDESGNTVIDRTITQGTTSTNGSWVVDTTLTAGVTYNVQVQVKDDAGVSSPWSNIGWMITNRPPSTTMTIPNGTQASPTVFSSLRPTLQWSQTDPDPGTTFTYFQIQITNEANDLMILDSGQYDQGTSSTTGNWTVNADLPAGQKLRVRVRVYDGYVWSDYSPQTWLYINRAPVADFDWSLKPVWEGDWVQLSNASYDADGDALSYEWKIQESNATVYTFSSKNVAHLFQQPGIYKVTLTVSDGFLSSMITKSITAAPLTIQSDVNYTDDWLTLHEKSGHQTKLAPKDFYSGEIFVVSSRSSLAPVDEVTAWMDTTGLDGHSLYVTQVLTVANGDTSFFKGELFDPKFQSYTEGLPIGLQLIHFQIRYRNGVVKSEDVPVQIIGNVNQSVGVHRVQ